MPHRRDQAVDDEVDRATSTIAMAPSRCRNTQSVPAGAAPVYLTTALGCLADAVGDAGDRPEDMNHGRRLQILRFGAIAARLTAMANSPEQARVHAQLFAQTKNME